MDGWLRRYFQGGHDRGSISMVCGGHSKAEKLMGDTGKTKAVVRALVVNTQC